MTKTDEEREVLLYKLGELMLQQGTPSIGTIICNKDGISYIMKVDLYCGNRVEQEED